MWVAAAKLDSLLSLSGELLVARRRAERRHDDIAELHDIVRPWFDEWRSVIKATRALAAAAGDGASEPVRRSGDAAQATVRKRIADAAERFGEDIRRMGKKLDGLASSLMIDQALIAQAADPLDREVRNIRMLPFSEACEGLARIVRDLAKARGSQIEFTIEGGDVELDRSVLEVLRDPLRHLVRNAVDHGIEAPDERTEAGKPASGRISVSARLLGGRVEITVFDDGRGIDIDAVREAARRKGLSPPEGDLAAARLLFVAGFSTSDTITEVSGRGVGLDAVRDAVESQRGSVDVDFEPGRGTRFRLTVPLTLTIQRALLVGAGGQAFAIDDERISTLLRAGSEDIRSVEGREVLMLDGAPVRVVALTELLGEPPRESPHAGSKAPVVVLRVGEHRAALMVDELIAEQEIVIKNLGPRLQRVRHVIGGTILADGRVALILNPVELVEGALGLTPAATLAAALTEAVTEVRKRLLLVDDSVTTRTLEKSILEAAGYEVTSAADGVEAWQLLQDQGADLLVSDVEMPRMDGVTLTETVRASKRFRELPVVLVTARESNEDKARGLEAGANAYLVKSAFDQKTLLEAIERLV